MIDRGKKNVLGVLVDAVDYEAAADRIIAAAEEQRPLSVTALAVHGVMTGLASRTHRYRLNRFDLVTPDGQPVRWAMNVLHRTGLPDRVYGPRLATEVFAAAAERRMPVYLYGSRREVLDRMTTRLTGRFPRLPVAGAEPSKFRCIMPGEKADIVRRIRDSGARIVFVGLGCPRQEIFAHEYRDVLRAPVIAVGAAFDYHAGATREPPAWVQDGGLQWLHRFLIEPRRLWKRYLLLNPLFLLALAGQMTGVWRPNPEDVEAPSVDLSYG